MDQLSASPTSEPASFLSLPPELRLMIYDYVLVAKNPIVNPVHPSTLGQDINQTLAKYRPITIPHQHDQLPVPSGKSYIDSSILSTCTAVYSEAWPHLYSQNVFRFTHPFWMVDFLSGRGSGKYRKAIRLLQLHIHASDRMFVIPHILNYGSIKRERLQEIEATTTNWKHLFDTWARQEYSGIEKISIQFLMRENSARSPVRGWKETPFRDVFSSLLNSSMWDHARLVSVGGLTNDKALNSLMCKGNELASRVELSISQTEMDGSELILYKNCSVSAAPA